jgi:membrane associated rhomboid family serine protease
LVPIKDNIPTLRFPVVTVALIVLNVAVFVWQLTQSTDPGSSTAPHISSVSQRDETTLEYGAIPYRLTHPGKDCAVGQVPSEAASTQASLEVVCQGTSDYKKAQRLPDFAPLDSPPWWATVFTSMFLHGGFLHIAFNMLFLWIFGNNVEDSMGRPRFLLFYLLAGVVAAYTQALLTAGSTVPTIGASGAIAGVLGGYLLLYPQARVLTVLLIIFFVTIIEIPASILLALWFFLQFVPALGQVTTSVAGTEGIAYWAHVGGFVFGLAAIKLFANRYRAKELESSGFA